MKFFFLALFLLCVLAVGIFGFRGAISSARPIEVFPDMDRQDKILGQATSAFFEDGQGARMPVLGSIPHSSDDGVFPVEFGAGRTGYYYTGTLEDYYANGMPEELELTADNVEAFLRRGKERYDISCKVCHGLSGDGKGVTSFYGIAGIANLHEARFGSDQYPDGRIFEVITKGKGLMGSYGASVPVRDRWAIVAYVRALQNAMKAGAAPEVAPEEPSTASN